MQPTIIFNFLQELSKNNNREWFNDQKEEYLKVKEIASTIFENIYNQICLIEDIGELKKYRIYRDIRFSLDKTPYKTHISAYFMRKHPYKRGGFYMHIENNNCFIAGGFWKPESADLLKIRNAIAISNEFKEIVNNKVLIKNMGELIGEGVKTAPKGFSKDQPNIEYIRKKQFLFTRHFSNKEFLSNNFPLVVETCYKSLLPFYDFMSTALTINSDGESLI